MALPTSTSSLSAANAAQPEQSYAIYPLTVLDKTYTSSTMVLGWIVEGHADPNKLEQAVEAVTAKWPMIGGRLERVENNYQLRIPLGPVAKGYSTMITTSLAPKPFSHYVTLPLPIASPTIPTSIMRHPSAPLSVTEWIQRDAPTICWHITHFNEGSDQYSCIGLSFLHLIYDGLGIAQVIHAVESELLGQPWEAPRMPVAGLNLNDFESALSKAKEKQARDEKSPSSEAAVDHTTGRRYAGVSLFGQWFMFTFVLWHWWQYFWHKSQQWLFALPPNAVAKLVDMARAAALESGEDIKLSRGDILAAWLYKVIYAEDKPKSKKIHFINFASLRRFFDDEINDYPHNCILPLPYPDMSVDEIQKHTIASLAQALAKARHTFDTPMILEAYDFIQQSDAAGNATCPMGTNKVENFAMSNMCMTNIVNVDWSGTGAGRVIARHKTSWVPVGVHFTNVVIIVGYLDDGTLTFDMRLTMKKLQAMEKAMQQLVDEAEGYKSSGNTV